MPTATVNGTTLSYDDTGPRNGVALVFSHSLFFNRSMFRHQVERFAADYRVVGYDHRGQGGSAPAPLESLDMDTLTDDAAALIEHLDLGPCHFLGNSMGGFVALRLAARRPELLRSAVALGSSAEEEHKLAEFGPLVEHLRRHGTTDVIDTLMYIMLGDASLSDPAKEELRREWRAYMLNLPPAIGDAAYGVIHRKSIVDELGGATVPVLAVAGAEDHAYPPPLSSQRIAGVVPGGRCVTVPHAGHSVALEQPAAVNEHLARHFAAVDQD
ncbi:alpha/beta fold hydrolase [Planosporangium thailandense]|uniref:Alpha/beta fold hydrolase n=1 Tax=Planosporangium thailandense TaxID=765197 RepID=A0ABX0Y8P9_9ACTN|nr:alpha/beta fold hydrolase [Planosporangium thailandense]NJC73782.1 alpha/beta fold hydrolase [Planosporangium thailandense]